MDKKIVHLNREDIKGIIRETLNEMTQADFQVAGDEIPSFNHTDRAFKVGDILCRMLQRTAVDSEGGRIASGAPSGRNKQVRNRYFNYITDVEGDKLTLDDGSVVSTKSAQIMATDTWFRVYQSSEIGSTTGISFDYETVNGELLVVMDRRIDASTHVKTGYRYEEVKNSKPGDKLKGIKMDADPELAASGFWIMPGSVKVEKSKNPMEGRDEIPRDFINFRMLSGMNAKAELFDSWNIEKSDEICAKFPWLAEKPTDWSKPIVKNGKQYANQRMKQSRCTPSTFKF